MIRTRALLCTLALAALGACEKNSGPAPSSTSKTPSSASATPPPNPLSGSAPIVPPPSPHTPIAAGGTHLQAQGFAMDIPESWTQTEPSSSMRAAQYAVPAPEGSDLTAGEFVLFRGIGGSAQDNIARWERQVADRAEEPTRGSVSDHGFTITSIVQFGTYDPGMAMPGSGPQPNWGFAGAVIEGGPEGPLFVRLTGPRPVVEAHLAEWDAVLQSILRNAAPGMR